jgi:hypothetical protein
VNYWWGNDLSQSATVADSIWHTVIATYDGTTRTLYLDGSLIASDQPGTPDVQPENFAIGETASGEFFTGTLDDVAVFDTGMTPDQVAAALDDVPLQPVPEPASLAALALGFIGAGFARRQTGGGRRSSVSVPRR